MPCARRRTVKPRYAFKAVILGFSTAIKADQRPDLQNSLVFSNIAENTVRGVVVIVCRWSQGEV
jgi:hypothetical protein